MECRVHGDFGCRTHHGFLNNCSFCAHTPSSSSSSSSSSPSSSSFDPSGSSASVESSGIDNGRGENGFRSFISGIFVKLIATILAFIFALVGSLIGAFTGALLGRATESGFFRGAGIGAISGAVFAIEVFESSLSSWHSDQLGIWNVMIEVDLIPGLLSGRLVREQVGSAMLSAVESQMSALDTTFDDVHDIFETGGAKSMPRDLVEKLPKIKITSENIVDASGDKICCAVCLQDFREGETARSLPLCQHMFHMSCIDSWLVRNGSCPLCRQDL